MPYKLIYLLAITLSLLACSQEPEQGQTGAISTMPANLGASADSPAQAAGRWYSPAQIQQGKPLYQQHCAACHGDQGQATPNWRSPDSSGHYPPPPLNGSAHTWHHSLNVLRRTVREGGARLGGQMPGFKDKLNDREIDEILAWVQNQWPDQIYQVWLTTRSGL